MNNLPIEDERAGKYKTPQNMIDFFQKEMKGGITVYYYGTYEEAGDFGVFSKIIGTLQLTVEQVEMFENDAELERFCNKYGEMLQANDPDCTVSYQIDFTNRQGVNYD